MLRGYCGCVGWMKGALGRQARVEGARSNLELRTSQVFDRNLHAPDMRWAGLPTERRPATC